MSEGRRRHFQADVNCARDQGSLQEGESGMDG